MIERLRAELKSVSSQTKDFRETNSKLNEELKTLREGKEVSEEVKKLREELQKETESKDECYLEMETIFEQNQEWESKHVKLLEQLENQKK